MKIEFPFSRNIRIYNHHLCFLKNLFELAGYKISYNEELNSMPLHSSVYFIKVNNKYVIIDTHDGDSEYLLTRKGTTDFSKRYYNLEKANVPIFKAQLKPNYKYSNKIFPFSPIYVVENRTTYLLTNLYKLKNIGNVIKSNTILSTNRIHSNAKFTRKKAFDLINRKQLNKNINFDFKRLSTIAHYKRHKNLMASLNISGATLNTLDAGPMESMFLGVCVIGNNFDTVLTGNNILTGGEHYIQIKNDYSDITEKINYVYDNKSICKDISDNAYDLMIKSCMPIPVSNWIVNNVENYYLNNFIPLRKDEVRIYENF